MAQPGTVLKSGRALQPGSVYPNDINPNKALVITGGEPMLQQKTLAHLIDLVHYESWWTEIEAAGNIAPISPDLVS